MYMFFNVYFKLINNMLYIGGQIHIYLLILTKYYENGL